MSHALQRLTLRIVSVPPSNQDINDALYAGERILYLVGQPRRQFANKRKLRSPVQVGCLLSNLLFCQLEPRYVVAESLRIGKAFLRN